MPSTRVVTAAPSAFRSRPSRPLRDGVLVGTSLLLAVSLSIALLYETAREGYVHAVQIGLLHDAQFTSATAPLPDSAGQPVGSVGVEIAADGYHTQLASLRLAASLGLALTALFSTVLGLYVYRIRRGALRLEHDLRQAEARFRLTQISVDSASDAVFWMDPGGRFSYVNEAACQLLGYAGSELLKLAARDVDPRLDADHWAVYWQELRQHGSLLHEARLRRRDGRLVPVEMRASYIRFGGREFNVTIVRDVAEREKADVELRSQAVALMMANTELESQKHFLEAQQEDLEAINRQLAVARAAAEAANHSKSVFLANMSHEIRTPMTAILGFADNLLDPDLSESERRDAIHTIRRNGEFLLSIINDILDLSKIEADRLDLERIRCSPFEILSDVCGTLRGWAAERGLRLDLEYATPIPELILSDPTRVRQILFNVAGNAIKFTQRGGVRLEIRLLDVSTERGESRLACDIVDTGVGMSAEQVAKLFQPFSQADSSTTRVFGGTGLGLAISQRLARSLGGDVEVVETQPSVGTRFRITIATGPLAGVPLLTAPPLPRRIGVEITDTATEPPRISGRILLVEDGLDNQRLVSFILTKAGAQVSTAENGQLGVEAALSALQSGAPFDLILMDIQMPVMDGYDATRALRRAGYAGPIVALTAHAMPQERERCFAAGCDDYASKPIERRSLLQMVARHLQRRASVPDN